ncbi:UNVERIFIED_CONTAM: hypothetical protein GTU68_050044 [Idotea baltica]|nr:hypothetical protein [Idotea baltica]
MVFQDPLTALDPVYTVRQQLVETIRAREGSSKKDAAKRALELLEMVQIPSPELRMDAYPFELSGGMRQRVVIAMALACRPALLLADEPTTALDVTVQARVLDLLRELQRELQMGVIFVTHDLAVAAAISDRIAVMYAGRIVETGTVEEIVGNPSHPYSRGLINDAADEPSGRVREPGKPPVLQARNISKSFPVRLGFRSTGAVSAVEGLSLTAEAGETVGIVGESGCGKSTAARLLLGLIEVDAGDVLYEGEDVKVLGLDKYHRKDLRRNLQMVFQDPYSSLNPRASIGEIVGFPMKVHNIEPDEIEDRTAALLEAVGLHRNHGSYYPHQLSGGQRQRVNIARAVALDPKLVVCDEAVSALDKSVQAQVLELLRDLQSERGLAYIFISHDLNVVEYMSDQVIVMYLGQVVEYCGADQLYANPQHPYTQALLRSIPTLDLGRRGEVVEQLDGEIPSPINPPSGCRFRTRCPHAMEVCAEERPPLAAIDSGHLVACHLYPSTDSE